MTMPDNSRAEYYRRRAAEAHRLAEVTKDHTLKEAFLRNAQLWLERAAQEEHGTKRPDALEDNTED
jgi:hypothetical protein